MPGRRAWGSDARGVPRRLLLAGGAAGSVLVREALLDVVRNLLVAGDLELKLAGAARERAQARARSL